MSEPVYLYAAAVPAWIFYSTDWRAPDTARLRWLAAVTSATGPAFENSQPRGRAIPGARDSLRYTVAGRTVVLGVGSGVAYDYYASAPRSPRPDAGWADEEMRRLKRAAWDGSAWLLASHFGSPQHAIADTEIGDLVAAARGEGGTVRVAIARPTAALLRIEFARSAPAAAGGNVAGQ